VLRHPSELKSKSTAAYVTVVSAAPALTIVVAMKPTA